MYSNTHYNEAQIELDLENFHLPFGGKLNPKNRWVELCKQIPWQIIEDNYKENFSESRGPKAKSIRIALGSLIIKERIGTSDIETVEQIRENPYLQFFLGYPEFQEAKPFDPSLFVHFRKRIGIDKIQKLNEAVVIKALSSKTEKNKEEIKNEGQLKIDATCTPADIRYPTDVSLLNEVRENTEKIIDMMWNEMDKNDGDLKPRTYRKIARKEFISVIRKKKKSKSILKKSIRKQLNYVRRNLEYIDAFVKRGASLMVLSKKDYKNLLVGHEILRQQEEMYRKGVPSISNRIVSVSQPHIRPIVRGKTGKPTEFGAKISVAGVDGFVFLDRLEWESYHEGTDLVLHAEAYKNRFGFWPESIHADKAYHSRDNRSWCNERNIRLSAVAIGRPKNNTDQNSPEIKKLKKQLRQDELDRIEIEGKFGVAKRKYGLARIMSKLQSTSETTIAISLLVMNLDKILRNLFVFILRQLSNFWVKYLKVSFLWA